VTLCLLIVVNYEHDILSRFSAYQNLHRTRPFYFAESLDKVAGVIICFFGVWLMRRVGFRGICRELGLSKLALPEIRFLFRADSTFVVSVSGK
jgi:hypothetical protein